MNSKNDETITIQKIKDLATNLVHEREWQQFHTPKDLSMNLSVESNELLEKFLWITSKDSFLEIDKNRQEIEDEIGDILFSIVRFCSVANIDATQAFLQKIEKIKQKYPIEKSKGKHKKYNKL
ncbi:nucleotide pyrophosphohydrolase [Candidatus Babeliales bacterium]|nr:nucleotide pyrophosphohydrolase [Candidatus Babeliales bacterium]